MSDGPVGVLFSVPYEIAAVRTLRQTSLQERDRALKAAGYNCELLPQEVIYIDLCTDSGVSALSTAQIAAGSGVEAVEPAMGMASEASRAFASLSEQYRKFLGFSYLVPTTQGRTAERIWAKIYVKPGTVVPGNMLFPSTRMHIEANGGKVIDVIGDCAHNLQSEDPFKGDFDLDKLAAVFREHGDKVSFIYVELSVNACGGHPVSLGNLKKIKAIATANGVPLFLDACRILENSYLIRQRETGYHHRSIREIVFETCESADGCTMSAMKDLLVPIGGMIGTRDLASYRKATMQAFLDGAQPPASAMQMISTAFEEIFAADAYVTSRVEQVNYLWRRLRERVPLVHPPAGHAVYVDLAAFLPHVAPENHRAAALAAFLYYVSGVRVTKGPPAAPAQSARGTDLLRLAVPARKYAQGHLDDVAEALLYAYAHRNEIKGFKQVEDPQRSKYEPSRFEPL